VSSCGFVAPSTGAGGAAAGSTNFASLLVFPGAAFAGVCAATGLPAIRHAPNTTADHKQLLTMGIVIAAPDDSELDCNQSPFN
ncbi:MAG: hypothetical protein WAK13_17220, partial [Terriglobales bacterium]